MANKRMRSSNWDEEEKQLFRSVFKQFAEVIENKSLDTHSNRHKNKAWEDVHKKFNKLNCRPRQLSQMKILWKNMKMNARKAYSSFKKESNKTRGGGRPASLNDDIIEVKDLSNPAKLLRDNNIYDSDGLTLPSANDIQGEEASGMCVVNLQDIQIQTIADVDEQEEHQKLKAKPVIPQNTTPLKRKMGPMPSKETLGKRFFLKNTIDSSSKSRMDHEGYLKKITEHSKELKEKEHARRMEMAEEKHYLEIEILKESLKTAQLERQISENKLKTFIN